MGRDLYDMLLSRARTDAPVRRVLLGLSWSVCQVEAVGVCFSPRDVPRTLSWSGTLRGRSSAELAPWVRSFDAAQACVGASVINALINRGDNALQRRAQALAPAVPAHLQVFAHFAPQLQRAEAVTVIGRYPGLERLWSGLNYRCLERCPGPDTLPDTAAEQVLPRSEWVFITGSAIANHTLPRLLALSREASVVLMGPSVPWLEDWAEFGVDYVAGCEVTDTEALFATAAEGGGTRIFETGLRYRLASLA
jgi:hypothetical protein